MFNGSFLRVSRILRFVKKIRFSLLESGRTKAWCPGLVSRSSAKAQEQLARSRWQWQEVEGLLFNPKNSQLVHILIFCSQGVVFLFIFPTGPTALDSEPHGRRYAKIRDTTGTVFIQGPSIVLPVWRSIIFNGSFLRACGFLIHLSNRSDNPRFRAPWKKIRQKYDIQQEPSLFKGHPLSGQYGEVLCSMVHS